MEVNGESMKAVIMAGGKGTRLQAITSNIPKPMVPILGKPVLEYQIESLKASDITNITLIIGHLGKSIQHYFGDGSKWNVNINYIVEEIPLGTAGGLFYLKEKVKEDFILIFGDLMLDIDWKRFMAFHKEKGGWITLYAHPNTHPYDSDVIIVDKNQCVTKIDSKNNIRNYFYHNFVNAGLYCISPRVLEFIVEPHNIDLEKSLIDEQISNRMVFAYKSTEYVKDMGVPERYYCVINDVRNKIVSKRSLRQKQKCIFLDRDGTINKHCGFLKSVEQFELLPYVSEAIKEINQSEYLVIVATNQPIVARGECSFEELEFIHMKMETLLGKENAYLDDIYYCPHHPHKGYKGEITTLKFSCDCRKPKIGMLTTAANKYNIDFYNSWYIGDTTIDIQTGINAGMHTILVKTGEAGMDEKYDVHPEYQVNSLLEAVRIIIGIK